MSSRILTIDRSTLFNPENFIGQENWKIEKGEEDERSLALIEVDLTKVRLKSFLRRGERYITGEENLVRARAAKHIRLDAKVFQALWENQRLIPESWKKVFVFFDGTILRSPHGGRCVLCLYCGSRWGWRCDWLDDGRSVENPSAVLCPS